MVSDLQVSYRGGVISAAQAEKQQMKREKAHLEFVIVYDSASSTTGLAHAFDTRAAADAYGRQVTSTPATTPLSTPSAVLPTTCPDAKNLSRMYDGANCGGTQFVFLLTESDPTFSGTGWNNKGNSLVVGWTTSGCTILIRLYPGTNYTYTEARFYGDSVASYYLFSSAQINNFESGKSTCS